MIPLGLFHLITPLIFRQTTGRLVILYLLLGTFQGNPATAQNRVTLSGTISELSSNEYLIGATVSIGREQTGTITNEYGFYSLTLEAGTYQVTISYIGYESITRSVNLDQNTRLNIQLEQQAAQLEEIVIRGDNEQPDLSGQFQGTHVMNAQTIREIPVAMGEPDVVKSLLLLPGVTNAGEASTGFNVRGGTADQNLILLDEATIYNASHLFGLFSVFNPDAVKDIKLFKAGIPARYGGRVSSVLEIFQKEGNSRNFKMSGGIGAVASRLLAEGPIRKDQSSFLVGVRGFLRSPVSATDRQSKLGMVRGFQCQSRLSAGRT